MSDDYRAAALKDSCFLFIYGIYSQLGNPPREIERFKSQAAAARKKAIALEDRRWREAYLGWCDYADRQIEKSAVAHAGSAERSRLYWEKENARQRRVSDLLKSDPPR